jgi:hypothetical protein
VLIGTLITLFLVPCLYVVLDDFKQLINKWHSNESN